MGTLANKQRVRGKLTSSNGDTYDGAFGAHDQPSGQGTLHRVLENVVHTGTFFEGRPHGYGERRDLNSGVVRRGEFDGDELHGEGEETLPGGLAHRMGAERYSGHFDRGVRSGRGKLQTCGLGDPTWGDDAWTRSWAGTWENGEPIGDCDELIERSRSDDANVDGGRSGGGDGDSASASASASGWIEVRYSGGWAHGTRHGVGTQIEPGGVTYEGQWHRGCREGRGIERDPATRETYEGEFLAGRRHGQGVVRRPNGWKFEGQFEAGVQRGEGTLTLAADDSGAGDGESGNEGESGGAGSDEGRGWRRWQRRHGARRRLHQL